MSTPIIAQITAPRGQKSRTIAALRAVGATVHSNGTVTLPRPPREDERLIGLCRGRLIVTKKPRQYQERPRRITVSNGRAIATLSPATLEAALTMASGRTMGAYRFSAEECVAEILRRVGPAGEQAQADEARYFDAWDQVQYKSSKHVGRDWREPSLAVVAPDGAAAIICYAEVGSYLHKGWYNPDGSALGGLHHLRFAVYLVVRDSTTGERHVLRVPPRFGRYTSATYRRYMDIGDRVGLIHAAVAWTFGLKPAEYRPDAES